ncbi:hypothetical protein [Phytohabitans houttuyneae]|nr:hypothetical protein [Phytohabitans houttuyneae]
MNALRALRGQVWLPGDDGFDTARTPWNLAVDQPVLAVVEAADADDVAALVRHARSAGVGSPPNPTGTARQAAPAARSCCAPGGWTP